MNKKKLLRKIAPGIGTKLSFFTAILLVSILAILATVHYNQQKKALEEKIEAELKTPLEYINSVVLDLENLNRSLVLIEEFKIRVRDKKQELKKFKKTVVSKEGGFLGNLKAIGQSIGLNVKRGNVYRLVDTYFTRYLSAKEIDDFETKVKNELRNEKGVPIEEKVYGRIRFLAEQTALHKIGSEKSKSRILEIQEELVAIETNLRKEELELKYKKDLTNEKEKLNLDLKFSEKSILNSDKKYHYYETLLTKALQNYFRNSYKEKITSLGLIPNKIRVFAYDKIGNETLDTGQLFPESANLGKKLISQAEYIKGKKSLFGETDILNFLQEKSIPDQYEVGGRQYEVLFRPVFRNPKTAMRAKVIFENLNREDSGLAEYLEEDKKISLELAEITKQLKVRVLELKKIGNVKPGQDTEFRTLAETYRKVSKKREQRFLQVSPFKSAIKEAEEKWQKEYSKLIEKRKLISSEILDWEKQLKSPAKIEEKNLTAFEIQEKIRDLEGILEETKDSISRMDFNKDDWSNVPEKIINDSFFEIRNASLEDFAFVPFQAGHSGMKRYYREKEERSIVSEKSKLFKDWVLAGNSETELPKLKGRLSFLDSGILVRSRSEAEERMWYLDSTPLVISKENKTGLVYDLLRKDLLGYNIILLDRTEGYRQIRDNRKESIRYAAIFSIFGIIFAYILAWFFVRKIKVISKRTEQIEQGNLNVEFPWAGYDEIGVLSESLNNMVRGLKEREEMRGELAAGEEIQKRLLPQKLPTSLEDKIELAAFYKAMAGVGGDYYDFIELSDGRLAFCIGDVSNHGVGPAIVMALFRAQIRSIFKRGERNLKNILLEANASLYEETPDHIFVTFFIGIFDPTSSKLEYISAGHVKPLYYDASRDKVVELPAGGLPLGMDENSFFESTIERKVLVMEPGDLFFQYTDGLDEARSPAGSFFGRKKISELLQFNRNKNAKAVIESMVAEAENFTGQNLSLPGMSSLSDDIAMIVIRKK